MVVVVMLGQFCSGCGDGTGGAGSDSTGVGAVVVVLGAVTVLLFNCHCTVSQATALYHNDGWELTD